MIQRLSLIGLVLLLAVSGCGTTSDEEKAKIKEKNQAEAAQEAKEKLLPICPQVAIVHELDMIEDFGAEKPDADQFVAKAQMRAVQGTCEYRKDGINVVFDLNLAAYRGPRLGGLHTSFPYFVAVVSPTGEVLNKDRLTVEFGFSSSEKLAEKAESLHVFIPLSLDDRSTGPGYQVLMGFQLTEDQLKDVIVH